MASVEKVIGFRRLPKTVAVQIKTVHYAPANVGLVSDFFLYFEFSVWFFGGLCTLFIIRNITVMAKTKSNTIICFIQL